MTHFNTGNGLVIGLVEDLKDPEGMGRVRVKYPTLGGELSDWARVVSLMAGKDRGMVFIPDVGDEVMMAFEGGDPRRPYVLGAVWSKVDTIPQRSGKQEDNHQKLIKTRSGHKLIFDDTPGQEFIQLVDKDGTRKVTIHSGQKKIEVLCQDGDVEVTASTGTVKVKGMTVTIEADQNMTISANGTLTIKGATVAIN